MAAVPAVLAVASAGASIYSGISGMRSANKNAKIQRQQADLAAQNAFDNAQIHANEVRKFAAKQKLSYIANGVNFEGSALLGVDDTLKTGQKEVDAMTKQGNAQAHLGYASADVTQASGRAALVSGFGQASTSLYSAYDKGAFNGLKN